MGIVSFLYGWQELVGNLLGAFIAVILSFFITLHYNSRRQMRERQAHYSNLLLVLYDLQHFITQCESHLKKKREGKKPFDRISINDKLVHAGASHVFYLEIDFYKNAQSMYGSANVIKSKLDQSKDKEATFLMKENLTSFYHKFNVTANEIRKLQDYYGHLKFPSDLQFYSKEYVENKIEEFKLKV